MCSAYRRCKSSFNGKISEIPGIAVDNFENENVTPRAFFLSHYHRDHIQGLDTCDLLNKLAETDAFIYTTELTAAIIENKINNSLLLKYVKVLAKGSNLITLPRNPKYNWDELCLEVTLIPAGHCIGSTMYLFRTLSKTVLYTGDFRISCNDISKYVRLHTKSGDPIHIDAMYIDTTFIDEKFEDFPKRSDTVDQLMNAMKSWLLNEKYAIAIYTPANYTHEFIFNEIYKRLKRKVYVGDLKWKLYSSISHLVPGATNDRNETRIHLCSMKWENSSHKTCIPEDYEKYLYVYLTAMRWQYYNTDFVPLNRVSDTRIDACFATHCSRREIREFVNHFSPIKVEGFPKPYSPCTPVKKELIEFVLSPKKRRAEKREIDCVKRKSFVL